MDRYGAYSVVRRIGKGGMGEVFEVVGPAGGRYALKTLLPGSLLASPEDLTLRERFLAEATLLAQLDHPHVVTVHTADLEGRVPYMVQDLLTGGSLQDRLRTGPLPVAEAVDLVADLADGLEHAHRRGVLHRDLKPENVMFDERGTPRVVDFGLARALCDVDRLTRTGEVLGTPAYMAPEQALGDREQSGTVDVYGLGAILYAALTGEPPFQGASLMAVLSQVAQDPPRPPRALRPEVPEAVEAICLRALAKAPEARFASAAELSRALRAGQAPPAVRREGPGVVPVIVGGVVLVLALVLGVAVRSDKGSNPTPSPVRSPTPTAPSAPTATATGPTKPDWVLALESEGLPRELPPGLRYGEAAGDFVNTADGSVLVWVRAGRVELGPDGDDRRRVEVRLTRGFFFGKHEVTRDQVTRFFTATKRKLLGPKPWERTVSGVHPAVRISWGVAEEYCRWAGLQLPTEAEWVWAARGPKRARYPWGDAAPGATTFNGQGDADGYGLTSPIGAFPLDRSWCGALDLGGNVREWVADHDVPLPLEGPLTDWVGRSPLDGFRRRVTKGGNWRAGADRAEAHRRFDLEEDITWSDAINDRIGFRVCRRVGG